MTGTSMFQARNRPITLLAILWLLAFSLLGIGLPLYSILKELKGTSTSSLQTLFDPLLLRIASITVWQAFWSTAWSLFFGIPLGMTVGKWMTSHPHSKLLSLLALPFAVPSLVAALAWVTLLSHTSWSYTFQALILAHVFLNTPLIALNVAQARSLVPLHELEAATTLGGTKFDLLRFVLWPRISLAAASAAAQVFALCAMSFTLVMILGGGPPVQTLETLLYSHLKYGFIDPSAAAACALWEVLITLTPWILFLLFKRKSLKFIHSNIQTSIPQKHSSFAYWILVGSVLLWILPYFSIATFSIFTNFIDTDLRHEIFHALWISAKLAGISACGAVTTAVAALLMLKTIQSRSWLHLICEILISLPSGISALVLGLGIWLTYGNWIDPFEGSLLAMAGLQCVLFFPLAYRILWPLAQSNSGQLEAAVTLGASWRQAFWWIEWPRWKWGIFSALSAVAGGSLAEFGAASLFYSEKLIPVSILITQWRTKYHFMEAQGLAGLLLLFSFLLIGFSLEVGKKYT